MEQIAKRAFDIAASGAALLVLSPVLAASALGIAVSDPGPVFYMANRVGLGNSRFKMFNLTAPFALEFMEKDLPLISAA